MKIGYFNIGGSSLLALQLSVCFLEASENLNPKEEGGQQIPSCQEIRVGSKRVKVNVKDQGDVNFSFPTPDTALAWLLWPNKADMRGSLGITSYHS